jgi:hypothetical protein
MVGQRKATYGTARPSSQAQQSRARPTAGRIPKSTTPLVDPAHFVQATRDSGYRSPTTAIAEFVDNALQANATNVSINLMDSDRAESATEVLVIDDGTGMDPQTLHLALSFGGSTRFDDRRGLGRYGMGLPNAALSVARRVDVYTWQSGETHGCYLDLDSFSAGRRKRLPSTERVELPPSFLPRTDHGTAVLLTRCDRLGYKRMAFLRRRLQQDLGRIFRHFIGTGTNITVDGDLVTAIDPLFLMSSARLAGASPFGDALRYSLDGSPSTSGEIVVRFSELPIEDWYQAPNKEKRRLGITNAPTVSILRANREIDSGWFFMGDKRRENYDDWWRCEINFDPHLDEIFGVTHTKQGIRPSPRLVEVLSQDLEPIGRALSKRVRKRFEAAKASAALSAAEARAAHASSALPPLPDRDDEFPEGYAPVPYIGAGQTPGACYRIRVADLKGTNAYDAVLHEGNVLLLLNRRHPLYRDLYAPLADSWGDSDANPVAERLALMLLALGHAEVAIAGEADQAAVTSFLHRWSDVLATFLHD